MNHRLYGPQLAASYNRGAQRYRIDDEVEVRSENHHRIGGNLRRICRSFPYRIRVLEIGCGTGRYFHWLDQVQLLVGTDLSEEMLKHARNPACAHEVTAAEIRLIPGNLYDLSFDAGCFDFIYCLGVFGYGAALTPELCRDLHRWLTRAGRMYFDAIEVPPQSAKDRLKEWIKATVVPQLPYPLQQSVRARKSGVPVFRHTRAELERVMAAAGFSDFAISSNHCHSPLWSGVHLECVARKDGLVEAPERSREFNFALSGEPARSQLRAWPVHSGAQTHAAANEKH